MSDLVKRLRQRVAMTDRPWATCPALCTEAADRIEQLEASLRKIAQHDMQAIAMDALRPGERVPLEGKDD